jgi:hypothetical protein
MTRSALRRCIGFAVPAVLALSGCKEEPKKPEPTPPAAVSTVATKQEAPKPLNAPTLLLSEDGLLINGDKVDPVADKIVAALKERPKIVGESVKVTILRATKMPKVDAFFTALRRLGATAVVVGTQGRDGKEASYTFGLAANAPACSPVAHISKEMIISVWPLGGGSTKKLSKGMAGPDITQGSDAIAAQAGHCEGAVAVVSGEDPVTFGLVFDLARAATAAELKGHPAAAQLLGKVPAAGRKVSYGD